MARGRTAAPASARLQLGQEGSVRFGGAAIAVLMAPLLDIDGADPARRAALLRAFSDLCASLVLPLQLVVQSRRRRAPGGTAPIKAIPAVSALSHAAEAHRNALLERHPVYDRTLFLTLRAAGNTRPGLLDHEVHVLERALASGGVPLSRLTGEALLERLAGFGLSGSAGIDWRRGSTTAGVGGTHVAGYFLTRLPGSFVEPGWLAPVFSVEAEGAISVQLWPIERAAALHKLDRRLRILNADQLVSMQRGTVGDAEVDAGSAAVMDLRHRLAANHARPLAMAVTACATADDQTTLRDAARELAHGFRSAGCQVSPAYFRHLDAWRDCLPLGWTTTTPGKLVDSGAVATCIPAGPRPLDDPGGYRLGWTLRDRSPLRLAPFDATRYRNANIAVLASSGQGKTFAVGALILEAFAAGVGSLIVDPEGEYAGVVRALGGSWSELGDGSGALNVFDTGLGPGGRDPLRDVCGSVAALVETFCATPLDEAERLCIEVAAQAAIYDASRRESVALLEDCARSLRGASPRVAAVFRRLCDGPAATLFNRATSIQPDRAVTALSLRELNPELVPAAAYLIAQWLWSAVRHDPRPRHVVFDEVGLLAEHRSLRTLLVQLARRCRKYSASLVVVSQNVGDLLRSEDGVVIATNPAIVLLGGHRGSEARRMADAFGLSPQHQRLIETAARGEFLLLAGDRRLGVHIDVSDHHRQIITGQT